MKMMKAVTVVGACAALVAAALLIRSRPEPAPELRIGSHSLHVLVADEPYEMVRGLGGRDALPDDTAMLFVFPADGRHGIWMKDMRFAIDIVWLDADGVVVDLDINVAPETYPTVFSPERNSRYVVEMTAGTAERLALRRGQQVGINLKSEN